MKLLVVEDVGILNTFVYSGSSPRVVDDNGSGTSIPITFRTSGRSHVPKSYFDSVEGIYLMISLDVDMPFRKP